MKVQWQVNAALRRTTNTYLAPFDQPLTPPPSLPNPTSIKGRNGRYDATG